MAATLSGIVYHDLNHNGQWDAGEPGIAGAFVTLYSSAAGCVTTQTDSQGTYRFSVTAAGSYTVYEPVSSPGACPPTVFTQPAGFTMSNGPRKLTVAVTAAQATSGTVAAGPNFGHDTTQNPLDCSSYMIQFAGRPTNWYNIDLVTGASTLQGPVSPAHNVNAIGYHPLDHYLYGYDQTTNALVRVDRSGQMTQLPRPAGLPADTYTVAAFDPNGFFYLFVNNTSRFYTVDLRPNSATFLKLVSPAAGYAEQTASYGTALSAAANISDWVYDRRDGNLYGVQRSGVLTRIVPSTGQVTSLTTSAPNPNASFGALAMDDAGRIYAIANNDGTVYRYTFSGNLATGVPFSQTFFDSFNDGTLCPDAVIRLDYGDAPDTGTETGPDNYNTTLANNGPRHALGSRLTLGTQVTAEPDAYPNANATGDDLAQGIQDDGVSTPLPPLTQSAPAYTLPVTVTNETGRTAYLYGWLDFNQNGLFEADEASAVIAVPSAPGPQVYDVTFFNPTGTPLAAGHTFLRLRVTTDDLTETPGIQDSRSVGPASDGEVEDYLVGVGATADLAVEKMADLSSLSPGEVITYTIVVTNHGPDPATDVMLLDTTPPGILYPHYSLDGGSWFPWTDTLPLGILQPGESVSVLLQGVYDGTGASGVFNTANVTTTASDPDLSNNTSTVITPVVTSADLEVIKRAEPDPATVGQPLTYVIDIYNHGPNTALAVLLADAVPSALLDPEFSTDGGATFAPWVSPYMVGDLPAGSSFTVLLRGIVDPAAAGTLVNTATVFSQSPDPNPDNNSSTVETPLLGLADLSITKLGSPKPVRPNELLTYTLVLSNAGPSEAEEVTLTDELPDGLENGEFSTDGGASWQSWNSPFTIGTLAPGATVTVLLRGIVSPSARELLVNTASVDSPTPDPDPGNNTATDDTPVEHSADLSVKKSGSPNPVETGEELTYTISVSNAGPSDAQDVTVTDTVPAGLQNAQYSLSGGSSWEPWPGSASLGTVAAGDTVTLLLRGTVDTNTAGTLANTVAVASNTPDPDPGNNEATEIVAVNSAADLSVTKSGSPSPALPGQPLLYTVTVSNAGPNAAEDVRLTDTLPAALTNPAYSTDGGTSWQSWIGSLSLGTLAAGDTTTILLRGTVAATASGTLSNTAEVSSDTPDPYPDNNRDTEITPVGQSADVSVRKVASPVPVRAGEVLTYTVTVANAGPNPAQNVRLTDAVPAELASPEFSVNGGAFSPWVSPYTLGTLAAGAVTTVTIRGTVDPATPAGTLSNTASASSDTPDPRPDNNRETVTTPVETLADLSVVKTADQTPAVPGQPFGYTLTVLNAGPSDAQGVTLVDTVPVTLQNPTFSVDGGAYAPWTSPYTIGTLPAGDSRTIRIRGTVDAAATGSLVNTAVVNGTTPDPDPQNNTSTDETPLEPSADLSILKTASPNPATAGGQIVYTLLVSNAGPSPAENVSLTDTLPAGLQGAEVSTDGGQTWQAWAGSASLGTLSAGGSATVLLRATVPAGATGTLSNTATVQSETPDPNRENNTDTIVTPVAPSADVSVVKTASPQPASRGEELTYTLVVSNAGPAAAQNVILRDTVPAALQNVQVSADGGSTWQAWSSPYAMGTLPAGSSQTLLLRGTVSDTAAGQLINTAVVSSDTPDPDPQNNTSTAETTLTPSADLSVVKTAQPDPAVAGEPLTYTVTVTNRGPDPADNVLLYDALPDLTGAEFSVDGGQNWRPWSNPYAVGTLAGGQSVTIRLRGTVSEGACGTVANTAVVTSQTPDPDPANNTDTVETPVGAGADLSLLKTANPPVAVRCRYLTYTLTIFNNGPQTAEWVRIADTLPAALNRPVFSDDGGRTWHPWMGSWLAGSLPAGDSLSILIAGIVDSCAREPLENTAVVSAATPDPDPSNNSMTITTPICR